MTLQELRDKRAKLIADARALLEKAKKESRGLSTEEQTNYDKMLKDQDDLRTQIKNEETIAEAERDAAAAATRDAPDAGKDNRDDKSGKKGKEKRNEFFATPEYREAFEVLLRGGPSALTGEQVRALQANQGSLGGFLVLPQEMSSQLVKFIDDDVIIRGKATKFQVPAAQSLGFPSLDADPADADWTTELGTGNEDSDMAFGKRELFPHPLAKRIKVSNKLLSSSVIDVESLVLQRLGYKFAVTEEKAYMTGSGSQQPLGLFTASAMGISTGRDVATGNSATAISFDGLINAKYSLKAQYMRRAEWLFHRDAIKQIAGLKDGQQRYLWEPSTQAGQPDMILGRPVNMSEFVPNTFTTGLYVGMFADFSFYWIADAMQMQVQRLAELYAETNQTGFIARRETDGMPVLEEAFARVKLG